MESKKSDFVKRYREYAEFQFATDGEGLGLRQARQALAPDNEGPDVMALDALVIETLETADYVNPLLIEDRNDQPLIHWWWHLGKLRAGAYPAHLLPSHLRAIYQPNHRHAA
jgi:hypothetical protein